MEKSTNINDFLSSDVLSSRLTQTTTKLRRKRKCKRKKKIYKKCNECNKIRTPSVENNKICYTCYTAKKIIIPSGNKVIDDFIRYTQTNYGKNNGKMIFVPYEKFENIEFIGEGGFSK